MKYASAERGNVNGTVGLTYNNDFRVTQQTIDGANAVSFDYDDDGLMTSAGDLKMAYNATTGQLVSDTLGIVVSTYEYSDFGELKKYTARFDSTILFQTEYARDALGRITQLTETDSDTTNTFNYIYDTAGRLTEVKENSVTTSEYVYDSNGNRLMHIFGIDTTFATYDEQDRLVQYGNDIYKHNKNGYLTTKISGVDTTYYSYDNLGNLVEVTLPNGDLIEYIIDGQNRRVGKIINGNVVSRWLYQDELNPVAELDSLGQVVCRYVYGSKSHVPDYIIKSDTTYKVVSDHLGSVRLVVNISNGEFVQRIDYDEFGNVLLNNGESLTPFAFAGGIDDSQTHLTRFGARDYEATTGRWSAKDPMDFDGNDLDLYGYVLNDPINSIDIRGTFSLAFTGNQQLALIGLGGLLAAGAASQAQAIGDAWSAEYFNMMNFVVTAALITNVYFGTWRGDPSNPDDESGMGGFQKMPDGNNQHFNKMFKEAIRILGVKEGTDAARKLHDLISGQGLRTLKEILEYIKNHGI